MFKINQLNYILKKLFIYNLYLTVQVYIIIMYDKHIHVYEMKNLRSLIRAVFNN